MRIVVALGGNALLRPGEPADALAQRNVELAARGLAEIAAEHELIVTHGMVGYMLDLALHNVLPDREVVTVVTEVVVDSRDPAFLAPSKPIGPADARRLVASPEPQAIVELRSLRTLIASGAVVICAAAAGVPVALGSDGMLHGVEAVVDKDLTAALLARRLDADVFAMLTDVDGVHLDWGGAEDRRLDAATPTELREHCFEAGSMGPKVEAACRFVEATGGRAAIGALEDAAALVRGGPGTQIAQGA